MQTIPFEKLYNTDFIITEPMAKKQYWSQRGNSYNALGKPKVSHTLLWFKNCSGVIIDDGGNKLYVKQNQLVFTSKNSEYKIEFIDTNADREDTVVIHFQMTDIYGEDIIPTERPIVCVKNVDIEFAMLIEQMAEEFNKNIVCIPELKTDIYKILTAICQNRKRKTAKSKFNCIREGIKLLEQDSDMKISEIAEVCGVSECYFRRLFKKYSGESPMDFRQRHRMEKAKQLLFADEGFTINEIAEELNFNDIYHFSKTFKKYIGVSPNKYLKSNEM